MAAKAGFSTGSLEGTLVALRCTQRLLRRVRPDALVVPGDASNALGHWYANLVTLRRRPYVLAMSERSLLAVVLPAAPFSTLLGRLPP